MNFKVLKKYGCIVRRQLSAGQPMQAGGKSLCSKLTIIGGGKMAEAILNALHTQKIQKMADILVIDPNAARLGYLREKYLGLKVTEKYEKLKGSEIVILAVKPQHVAQVADSLNDDSMGGSLLLSIVAGATIDTLRSKFKTDRIVRSMPNTPAAIMEGITVWTATPQSPSELVEKASLVLNAMGEQINVSDELYLDMATAVSGSGPAYIFLAMESLVDAAVHLGFPRETAEKLVTQTIKGSAAYAQQSGMSVSELRYNVTSPGGTTASALYALERGGFRTVCSDAVWAAYRRALELGGNDPRVGPDRNKFSSSSPK